MWGLSSLVTACFGPRKSRRGGEQNGEPPQNGRRRGRRRKPPGLAPLRVPPPDAGASENLSPLSGRLSIAFSDSEYHDALEELPEALSSRGSVDGAHTPRAGAHGHGDDAHGGAHGLQQHGSVVDRIALWWEGRKSTSHGTSAGAEGEAAHTPRGPGHGHGAHATPRSQDSLRLSPDEVIEPSPDSEFKSGCIHLFSHSHGHGPRRFLRLTKPAAGSSFRGAAEEAHPGSPARLRTSSSSAKRPAGSVHSMHSTPLASPRVSVSRLPPSPLAPETPAQGPIQKLLARLSPRLSEPGEHRPSSPLLQRILSPRRFRRKTEQEREAQTAAAWEPADGRTFMVRSLNYMRTKVKEPSEDCIYRLLGVDVYHFDFKLFHIAQHVQLPAAPVLGPEAQALPRDQQLPPLLIINLQLPWYPASLFGSNDGDGHSLVYYFALPEGWEPSQVPNKAALELVQRFMHNKREFDGTPTRDRLKLIPRIVNVAEWAEKGPLSGYEHRLLMNYNDKPLLTRPQHRFYTGPNYLEIDMDVHNYAYIARKAFYGFIHRLAPVVFENAFVVQGNRPEELPEQLLAAARVYRVDFEKAMSFPAKSLEELGNGTGPAHDGVADR